jgi:hypothetical protein
LHRTMDGIETVALPIHLTALAGANPGLN